MTTTGGGVASTPSAHADRVLWLVVSAVVLLFYFWTATSSSQPADWEWRSPTAKQLPPSPDDFYNLLASGFLAGHLYLPVQPSPQILALKDPYGADTTGIRVQDASLYKGKYYVYYGVTPALTLFLPWRLVSGHQMPQSFATLIYAFTGYLSSCLLLFLLLKAVDVTLSLWTRTVVMLALGLGNLAPVLIRRPGAVYEVAITAGFCFVMTGLYLLARWIVEEDTRRRTVVGAGLCFGLAAGCRPHYGLTTALILVACTLYVTLCRRSVRPLIYFATVIIICGVALAAYNYARFDNPFEFGTAYQITGSTIARVMLHGRHIIPTLYFYFFSRPLFMDQFPYLQLMRPAPAPFGHPEWMPWINLEEEFAGILTIAPLCVAGIVLPLALLHRSAAKVRGSVKLIVLITTGAALAMLLFVALAGSIGMRYHVDYAPELMVAGLFTCFWLSSSLPKSGVRKSIQFLTLAAGGWATFCSVALSINGYNHSLRMKNPELFQRLTQLTGGKPEDIRYPIRQLAFDATIRFGAESPGAREALVSSGVSGAGDVLLVEYSGNGRLRFIARHYGAPLAVGPEIYCAPGVPHQFSYNYARINYGLLNVSLDGQRVLFRQGEMYFTAPAEVSIGRDLTASGPQPFSGRLDVKDGVRLGFGE